MDELVEKPATEPSDVAVDDARRWVEQVTAEFAHALSEDEVSRWLLHPNDWLGGAVPTDTCASDLPAVLAAARADRWVAMG